MHFRRFAMCTTIAASSGTLPPTGFAACDARSGPKTAGLVELYTSAGCSSCPPVAATIRVQASVARKDALRHDF